MRSVTITTTYVPNFMAVSAIDSSGHRTHANIAFYKYRKEMVGLERQFYVSRLEIVVKHISVSSQAYTKVRSSHANPLFFPRNPVNLYPHTARVRQEVRAAGVLLSAALSLQPGLSRSFS
ncbi:hypothetical protein AVEN_106145-1 [Araneus ventricosus]|uniref:Uncharacterized protein n=1 Tax=Araneus ventricosus TaxID=182803 RepID=A0A4Y2TFL3_ARAVE|nr:hypothetical protein AVEN_106145-1 [Araneus ventricosus]